MQDIPRLVQKFVALLAESWSSNRNTFCTLNGNIYILNLIIRLNIELLFIVAFLILNPNMILLRCITLIFSFPLIKKKIINIFSFIIPFLLCLSPLLFDNMEYSLEKSESNLNTLQNQLQLTDHGKAVLYLLMVIGVGFAAGFTTYQLSQRGLIKSLDLMSENGWLTEDDKKIVAQYKLNQVNGSIDFDFLALGFAVGFFASTYFQSVFPHPLKSQF